MSSIQFQPLIPISLWLGLATCGVVVLTWYGAGRPSSLPRRTWAITITLTGFGLALVLFALLNPLIVSPAPRLEGKPLVTILADRSASMAVTDGADHQTRFQTATGIAAELLSELSPTFDIQLRTFADRTVQVSENQLAAVIPDGEATDLATAITESLDGSRVAGQSLVILSDGIHNVAGGSARVLDAAQTAHAMSVPIFASTIGGSTSVDDLDLSLVRQQELAFVGQRVPLRVMLTQRGKSASEVAVEVLDETGKVVERKQLAVPPDGAAHANFHVARPTAGLNRYLVRTPSLPREATADNNSSTFVLRTVRQPIRVLLLEGNPYWDSKFLMRTLAKDDVLEVDSVVRVANGRFVQRALRLVGNGEGRSDRDAANAEENAGTARRTETTEVLRSQPPMLAKNESLAAYQIIVLGRDAESYLTDSVLERLQTWLASDGGSLVCFRGAPVAKLNQQLARLMPVRWTPSPEARFRMQLTTRGQDLNWIAAAAPGNSEALGSLPSLATSSRVQQPSPQAVVVAESPGQTQPVISYQPYGLGRVVVIEGAGMWRWSFLSPEHQQAEPIYDAMWQGLMRWLVAGGGLAPGQQLALRAEKVSFYSDESVAAMLLVREESLQGAIPRVELQRDGEVVGSFAPAAIGDEPGVYRIVFGTRAPGTYLARVEGVLAAETESTISFDVRRNYIERLDTASRPDLLAQIAERSGGAMLSEVTGEDVSTRFRDHLVRNRPLQVREVTIWDRWWVLALIVGLWGTAWGLRRRRGLI